MFPLLYLISLNVETILENKIYKVAYEKYIILRKFSLVHRHKNQIKKN